ncbi:hypothetical protein N9Y89_00505 [bacterium]|nr:hypothetical protein [bacterium]
MQALIELLEDPSHFDLGLSALWGEYEGHYYDEYYCEDMALVRDLTLFNLNAKFHLFKYDDVLVRPLNAYLTT